MLTWMLRGVTMPPPADLPEAFRKMDILVNEMAEAEVLVTAWRAWLQTFNPTDLGCRPGDGPLPPRREDGSIDAEAWETASLEWQRQGCPQEPYRQRNIEEAKRRHELARDAILEGARLCRLLAAEAMSRPPYFQAPNLRLLAEKLTISIQALGWPHGDAALREALQLIEQAKREVEIIADLPDQLPMAKNVALEEVRQAVRAELQAHTTQDKQRRVTFKQALDGVPELGLPATAPATLYKWMGQEATARILGTDHRAKPGAQDLLVDGLLRLQRAGGGRAQPQRPQENLREESGAAD
jgi:hypothetical protein